MIEIIHEIYVGWACPSRSGPSYDQARDAELDKQRSEMLRTEFLESANRSFSTFDDLAHSFERIISRTFTSNTG